MLQSKPLGQRHPGILSSRPEATVLLTLSTSTGQEILAQTLNKGSTMGYLEGEGLGKGGPCCAPAQSSSNFHR